MGTSISKGPTVAQQLARFLITGCGKAVFAGRNARQCNQLPPTESGPGGGKFFHDRAVILFGMQGAIFADGIFDH